MATALCAVLLCVGVASGVQDEQSATATAADSAVSSAPAAQAAADAAQNGKTPASTETTPQRENTDTPIAVVPSVANTVAQADAAATSAASAAVTVPLVKASQVQDAAPAATDTAFSVTYFDVGQGDAALVQCDGRYMLVDGGPPQASSLLYSYLKNNGIDTLDYVVATHADTDHTGGIAGALQVATVQRAFCSVTQDDGKAFNSMVRYLGNQGKTLEIPHAGDSFSLGSAQVTVVGPVRAADNANDSSLMLRAVYGSTSFLFTGDASQDEERNSVDAGYVLDSDVLKVAHHGSAYSSGYAFLRAVMPTYAVISVGEGNSYGHPTDEALSRLRDCGATVFRTDLQGDITITSNGVNVFPSVQKNPEANTLIAPGAAAANAALSAEGYIGNKNSKKFHLPTCKTLPAEKNRVYFSSRADAEAAGYTPCGNCKP